MFGTKEKGTITFYYNNDSLFNDVSLLSSFMAKSIATSSDSVIDELSMTDDEKEVFAQCVKQTMPSIYEAVIKITSGVKNAFNDSFVIPVVDETDLNRPAGKYAEITIQDNKAYNENVLYLVDTTIESCLKYGVLAEFYSICLHADLESLAREKFNTYLSQLQQRLFQLKKKAIYPTSY